MSLISEYTPLQSTVGTLEKRIFSYVEKNQFDSLTEIYFMKCFIEKNVPFKAFKRDLEKIKKINFFDNKLYNKTQQDLYDLQKALSNFKFALISFIEHGIDKTPKKLFVLPPNPKGGKSFSFIPITPTGADYAKLFER